MDLFTKNDLAAVTILEYAYLLEVIVDTLWGGHAFGTGSFVSLPGSDGRSLLGFGLYSAFFNYSDSKSRI